MARPTFEDARARYVHRFTMEHMPAWARKPADNGKFYAPQYRTDREWYDNFIFVGQDGTRAGEQRSTNESWPLGQWLDAPYVKGN